MELKKIALKDIHPYERNPRRNDQAVDAVMKSIQQCEYIAPIASHATSRSLYIDLLWGSETLGLQHIVLQREKQGINIQEFLSDLPEVVENGKFIQRNKNGTFEFWYKGKMAVISPEYHGNKITFLLTAFKRKKVGAKAPTEQLV